VPAADLRALPPDRLIRHGELLTLDEAAPAEVVLALQVPTPGAVGARLEVAQAGVDEHFDMEIFDREFGGRHSRTAVPVPTSPTVH